MKKRNIILCLAMMFVMLLSVGHGEGGCAHEYVETGRKNPTCTQTGMVEMTCKLCMNSYTDTLSALGHSYAETGRKNATCTQNGMVEKTCTRCNDTQTETLTALGHSYAETGRKNATCTQNGMVEKTCTRCNDTQTETLTALGHNYVETGRKDATCTQNGMVEKTCTRCNDTQTETLTALGHNYVETGRKDATCTQDGKVEKTCTRCNDVQTETLSALGHAYVDKVVAPTLTHGGYTEHKCSRCNDTYRDNETPQLKPTPTPAPTATPEPASTSANRQPAAVKATEVPSPYGDIVTDEQAALLAYTADVVDADADLKVLVITAVAPKAGTYPVSTLTLSHALLEQLKQDGIQEIHLVVGKATVAFTLDMFEGEMVDAMLADMNATLSGFTVTVNPQAEDADGKLGCSVDLSIVTEDDQQVGITGVLSGIRLMDGDTVTDVTSQDVYPYAEAQAK